MLTIGCHLSISRGFYQAGLDAVSIGANSFQFFTRNPRGGKAKEINPSDIQKLERLMADHQFGPLLAHAAYTMNLASDKPATREFSRMVFRDDLERLKQLPESRYIFHPGSHVGQGIDLGTSLIIDALNELITPDVSSWILLEGMAGKGSEVGGTLEELKVIIEGVTHHQRLGICLDSCHLYSAGYNVAEDLDGVLEEVDKVIGLERLKAFHLNDSLVEFSSRKDRHATIGEGTLGIEAIAGIINHPLLRHLPFSLETPNELDVHKKEISRLKGLIRD
ncbi:MAG: deoxyribonuclease IV [Bacillota bacterium]|nr:deoxyribonuclease IV [Bacillota bacterium]MDW7676324.1 deoxyribonuclease IV [Bacillota bacterium]